jgi:outer membrane protein TolC
MLNPPGSMDRNTYAAEVTLNLPWLNRRKHESEIAEAKAQQDVAADEIATRRAEVFMQIEEALIRAEAARRSLALYRDTLQPQAEATLKAATAAYQHDRTDFLNLIDSQTMVLEVQSSYYRAAAELDARLADLERAVGAPVPRESAAVTENKQ